MEKLFHFLVVQTFVVSLAFPNNRIADVGLIGIENQSTRNIFPFMLPEFTQYTDSCGGFNLASNQKKLILYRNDDQSSPNIESEQIMCIFIVHGPVSAQLNLAGSSSSILTQSSSSQQSILTDEWTAIIGPKDVAILVFASKQSQGFQLKLEKLQEYEDESHHFKSNIEFFGRESVDRSISLKYADNYWRYLILQSSPRSIVNLSVQFVNQEVNPDVLKIYKFSREKAKFLWLHTFQSSVEERNGRFEGEPMLLYFQQPSSIQSDEFKLTFNDPLEPPVESTASNSQFSDSCGGFIDVQNKTTLAYVNRDLNEWNTCIWIIKASGPIGMTLTQTNMDTDQGGLSVQGFLFEESESRNSLNEWILNTEFISLNSFAILISNSKQGQRFRLRLRDLGQLPSQKNKKWIVTNSVIHCRDSKTQTNFSYPQDLGENEHKDYKRGIVTLKPEKGQIVQMWLTQVDLKDKSNYLSIYKYSERGHFSFVRRFYDRRRMLIKFEGKIDQSILFYIHNFNTESSFRFTYFCIDKF